MLLVLAAAIAESLLASRYLASAAGGTMSTREQLNSYIKQLERRLRLGALLRGAAILTSAALVSDGLPGPDHQSLRLLAWQRHQRPRRPVVRAGLRGRLGSCPSL